MTPLTPEQVRRLAVTERRWLAESADRLLRPVRSVRPSASSRREATETGDE